MMIKLFLRKCNTNHLKNFYSVCQNFLFRFVQIAISFVFLSFFAFLCLLFFLFSLCFCLAETFLIKTFCQYVSDLQLSSKKFFFVCVGLFWRFSERKIKNKKERESCNFPETQRYSLGHSSHISL